MTPPFPGLPVSLSIYLISRYLFIFHCSNINIFKIPSLTSSLLPLHLPKCSHAFLWFQQLKTHTLLFLAQIFQMKFQFFHPNAYSLISGMDLTKLRMSQNKNIILHLNLTAKTQGYIYIYNDKLQNLYFRGLKRMSHNYVNILVISFIQQVWIDK